MKLKDSNIKGGNIGEKGWDGEGIKKKEERKKKGEKRGWKNQPNTGLTI